MKRDSLLKSTSLFSLATLISRVLGVVRDHCIAKYIPSEWQDIFWVGFKIPSTFRNLFAEGALSAAFIPHLTRVREREGEEKTYEVSAAIFYALILIVGGMVVLAILLSPWFVPYILDFPSKPVQQISPETGQIIWVADWRVDASIRVTQYMFPFLFFVSLSAWAMGILNTYRYFFVPAIAPALFNMSLIVGAMIGSWYYSGMSLMVVMSMAVVVGGFLQFAGQLYTTWKTGFFPPRWVSPFHPTVMKFISLLTPSVFGLAIYQINAFVTQTYFASKFGVGGISQMNYAFRLIQFPLGVVGVALASASFPRVAQYIAQGRGKDAAKILSDVIKYLMLLIIPAAFGLVALGPEITGLIYDYGHFHESQWLIPTTQLLTAYCLGLFFYTVVKVLVQAFQAHHDFRTPVITGAISVSSNIALCACFVYTGWPVWSLALSSSIASGLQVTLLCFLLRSRMKELFFSPLFAYLSRILLASVVMALACWGLVRVLPFHYSISMMILRVVSGLLMGMLVYGAMGWVLFRQELQAVLRLK